MPAFRETNTTYVQQWRKRISIGTLNAGYATDFKPITGIPPSGIVVNVSAEVETDNQVVPRLRLKFYRTNTAQGSTEETSGATVIQPCGYAELSPMLAEKINGNTQIQETSTNDYVWFSGATEEIHYETEAGTLYLVIENFGAENITEGYVELYIHPREKGE